MTERIDAQRYLGWQEGGEWGPTNGVRLAEAILGSDTPWDQIVIDARACHPYLLGGNLVRDFLQRIYEECPHRLEEARAIQWDLYTDTERAIFGMRTSRFKPRDAAVVAEEAKRDLSYRFR